MGIFDSLRNAIKSGGDTDNSGGNGYVDKGKETVSEELEEKVGKGIRTLLKDEISKYNLSYEITNIESKGREENKNQTKYEVSFMVYGDKECFDINIEASEVPRADGGTFFISKGYGDIVKVGDWVNSIGEKEGNKLRGVDVVKEINQSISKFRGIDDNYKITLYQMLENIRNREFEYKGKEGGKYKLKFRQVNDDPDYGGFYETIIAIYKEDNGKIYGYEEIELKSGTDILWDEVKLSEVEDEISKLIKVANHKIGESIRNKKYDGLVRDNYKGSEDSRDRERVLRLVELTNKEFKVKWNRNRTYGDYLTVNVVKGLTLLVTPTLIINTKTKEEIYYKHDIKNNNLEEGFKKELKNLKQREDCKKLKVFLENYNKANDLRRKV